MKRFLVVAVITSLLGVPGARAGDGSWSNDAGGAWGDAANWVDGLAANGTDATAYFTNALTADCAVTNDLPGQVIGNLLFDGGVFAWSLVGSPLVLDSTAAVSLLSVGSGQATIGAPLSGAPAVVKAGPGTLNLAAASSFAGATIISNGTVRLQSTAILGAPVAGALYWLDASDTNTVVKGATNNVSQWSDKSGNGRNFLQANLANQPQFVANALAGKPVLRFNGASHQMIMTNPTTPLSVFIVHRINGYNPLGGLWGMIGDYGIREDTSSSWNSGPNSGDFINGGNGSMWTNGQPGAGFTVGTPQLLEAVRTVGSTVFPTTGIGEYGTGGAANRWYNGDYAEIVVYSNAVSAAERKNLESYLMSKWLGLTNTPPALNALPTNTQVQIAAGAVLDLRGGNQTVGSLSDNNNGGGTVTNSEAWLSLLTLGTDSNSPVFSGSIGGPIALTKIGAATQTLAGANTFTGGITVAGGTLAVGADANLGAASARVTLGAGATLLVTNTFAFSGARTLNLAGAASVAVAAGQALTLTNGFAASGSTLTKTEAGTLTIAQSVLNVWTGPLIVNGGTVLLPGPAGDAGLRNHVTVNSGSTLRLNLGNVIINSSTITVNGGGTFDMNSNSEAFAFLAGAGSVTNTASIIDAGIVLDLGGGSSNIFSGEISGAGRVWLRGGNGAGTQVFSGTNSFTNGVALSAGTLSVSQDANLGAAGGPVFFSNGTLQVTGTALQNLDGRPVNWDTFSGALDIADSNNIFTITNAIGGAGTLTKLGAGTLVLAASNTFAGAMTVSGGVLDVAPGAALDNASLNVNTGGKVYLTNGVNLVIGTLKLNGVPQLNGTWGATGSGAAHISDTYFGGLGVLTVTNGLSDASVDGSWSANASGAWGVSNNWLGGVIAYGANSTAYFTNALTANATVNNSYPLLEIGNLTFGAPTNNWTLTNNVVNLAVASGAPTVTVETNRATIASTLAGAQGLAKAGGGTLALAASNTFSGDATVNAGALILQNGGALGAAGAVAVSNGARLELQGGITVSGKTNTVSGDGGNFLGALQSVGGSNTWAGPVVLGDAAARIGASNGTLVVAASVTDAGSNFSLTVRGAASGNSLVVLAGSNTYGGNTVILGAMLRTTGDNFLNPAQSVSNSNLAGALDLNGNSQTFAGVGVADGGFLAFGNSRTNLSTLTLTNAGTDVFSAGLISGAVAVVKGGGGTQVLGVVNSVSPVATAVNEGSLVVGGSALNAGVVLSGGTTLVAMDGPGLVGEFYNNVAVNQANFNPLPSLAAHLSTLSPAVLFNLPASGTNLDFNAGGWPPGASIGTTLEARWVGKFLAPSAGTYYFGTTSDDGSMLWIDGVAVVTNNFNQGPALRSGTAVLGAGLHDLVIAYNNSGGGYGFYADVAFPGGTTNRLALGSLQTGPAVGGLTGPASSSVVLSNTLLTIAQTNHATFDGTIGGAGAIRKLGQGTLTLTAANAQTNNILGGGRLSVSGDAPLGGASAAITFDGGLLQITGTALTNLDTHAVNWSSLIGGFDIADAANTFVVTNALATGTAAVPLWKFGVGTLSLQGSAVAVPGGITVRGGRLVLDGVSLTSAVGGAVTVGEQAGDLATLILSGGTVSVNNTFGLGANAGAAGAFYQTGGQFNSAAGEWDIGYNSAGAYGYYQLDGGSLTNNGWMQVGRFGLGVMYQTGGRVTPRIYGLIVGNGSTGVLYMTGGELIGPQPLYWSYGVGARGEVTLAGSAVLAISNDLRMNQSAGTGFLNLNGGTLQANRLFKNATGGLSVVSFDGATVRAGLNGAVFMGAGAGGAGAVDAAYVRGGGLTFDTQGNNVTIAQDLLAPPGQGVTALGLTNGGSGYVGAPVVQLVGGGTGATAVAQIDAALGTVTNVLITSPGANYSALPVVTFHGGGGTGAGADATALGTGASGGLTKLGAGMLTLSGTNTYGGTTVISNGFLLITSTSAIPGAVTIGSSGAGIGATYPVDQDFINWLTSRLSGGVSPGIILIGTNTAGPLDFSALPNTSLGAAGGAWTFSGTHALAGTNLYLGNGNGTLIYAPNLGTGTNVFIGFNGLTPFPPIGAVQLNGTNAGYASTINVVSGTLKGGTTNCLGGAAATVNVAGGTLLDVNGQNLGPVQVYVQGAGLGSGAIVNSGADQANALQFVHLVGDATIGGPGRWDVRGAGTSLDLAGFTLTKTNANLVALVNGNLTDGHVVIGQGAFAFHAGATAPGSAGRITIQPAGTLDFNGGPSAVVTWPVTNNGGTISCSGGGVSLVGSAITLAGATNRFSGNSAGNLVLTGLVSGAGALQVTGSGPVTLAATEAYTGPTIVSAGTLALAASNALDGTIGSSSGLLVNGGNVNVDLVNGFMGTNARPVALSAGVLTASNGVYARIAGPLTFSGGVLAGGTPDAMFGNWSLDSNVTVTANSGVVALRTQLGAADGTVVDVTSGATFTVSGVFEDPGLGAGGTGTLIKAGAGTLALAGRNTYSGPTIVNAGKVKLLASELPVPGALYWLDASDPGYVVRDASGNVSQWSDKSGNGRNFAQATTSARPVYVSSALGGKPVVRFNGSSSQLIMASNTTPLSTFIVTIPGATIGGDRGIWGSWDQDYGWRQGTGGWYGDKNNADWPGLNNGDIYSNGVLGDRNNAPVVANVPVLIEGIRTNGTAAFNNTGIGRYSTVSGGGRYFQGDIAEVIVYGTTLSTVQRQTVEAYLMAKWMGGGGSGIITNSILPTNTAVRLAAGATLDLGGALNTAIGSLADQNSGGGLVTDSVATNCTLTIGNDGENVFFSGVIANGSGTVALVKQGLGAQTLGGASTYSGGTMVSNGALLVDGALLGTGAVLIASGGTLGGTGTVQGAMSNDGTVAPGASTGVLNLGGTYAQGSGTLAIELAGLLPGSGHDQLAVAGAASLGGTLTVTTNGFAPAVGQSFTVLTASAISGTFAVTNLPPLPGSAGWSVQYNADRVVLEVAPPALPPYDLWAQAIPNPSERSDQADPDNDGYENLWEYSQGTDPTNSADGVKVLLARTNGVYALKFNRATGAVDLVYAVEASYAFSNSAPWEIIASNQFGTVWEGDASVHELSSGPVRQVFAEDNDPLAPARGMRLRVTRP